MIVQPLWPTQAVPRITRITNNSMASSVNVWMNPSLPVRDLFECLSLKIVGVFPVQMLVTAANMPTNIIYDNNLYFYVLFRHLFFFCLLDIILSFRVPFLFLKIFFEFLFKFRLGCQFEVTAKCVCRRVSLADLCSGRLFVGKFCCIKNEISRLNFIIFNLLKTLSFQKQKLRDDNKT